MSEAGVLRGGKQEQRTQFMIGVGEKTGGGGERVMEGEKRVKKAVRVGNGKRELVGEQASFVATCVSGFVW